VANISNKEMLEGINSLLISYLFENISWFI